MTFHWLFAALPRHVLAAAIFLLAGSAIATPAAAPLDAIARDYVRLSLEAGARQPEYVDAYYGPAALETAAKASPRTIPQLLSDAKTLRQRTESVAPATLSPIENRRRTSLIAQLTAAETRLAMANGTKFAFADEARGLFGTAPTLKPLASYDPVLAQIDHLVPGPGPLADRVSAYRERFRIPADRLDVVMRAAIAECRARTIAHIALPPNERFSLEFVTGKPWSGYNYYKGDDASLVQVNTDLPVLIDRAVDLGCHEGYPGHHVQGVMHEEKLAKALGWIEYAVQPLYSPLSLLGEGGANYGIELAFPGTQRSDFEARILYPLAGLDPAEAARMQALSTAMQALAGSRFTIARDYLDGHIDRATAVQLSQKYGLVSAERAEKSIAFTDHYRSYVINYGHGRDLVAAAIEAAGPSPAARWAVMERLLAEPTVPADLVALAK
ncbi:MAG: hypothetical protein H7268_08035 [Sandarakinorhabdus sp.]|nr:hypothetical protein [Sandarakinorhabdus sp.]